MFKIAAILFFVTVDAKLYKPDFRYFFHERFNSLQEYPKFTRPVPALDAWVLSLNKDVDSLKLRQVWGEEVREVFGNKLDSSNPPEQKRMSKPNKLFSDIKKVSEKAMMSKIMRVINKFALTTNNEPDAYIRDDIYTGLSTIKLYFKNSHTSLVVRAEGRQWHYIIGPPSLFPEWFYEEHDARHDEIGSYVDVPKDVANEFYNALFHLLTMFFSFPV